MVGSSFKKIGVDNSSFRVRFDNDVVDKIEKSQADDEEWDDPGAGAASSGVAVALEGDGRWVHVEFLHERWYFGHAQLCVDIVVWLILSIQIS